MDFWRRLQTGFDVAVASSSSDLLLGVRDGFRRYFVDGLGSKVPIGLSSQPVEMPASGLPMSDRESVALGRAQARNLESRLKGRYQFYVSVQGGVEALEVDGQCRFFVRSWTVVLSPLGEAWGSSGSVELPPDAVVNVSSTSPPRRTIGTRRQGGITSALTAGLETRREATALSSFHALSGLCYGILQSRPQGLHRGDHQV